MTEFCNTITFADLMARDPEIITLYNQIDNVFLPMVRNVHFGILIMKTERGTPRFLSLDLAMSPPTGWAKNYVDDLAESVKKTILISGEATPSPDMIFSAVVTEAMRLYALCQMDFNAYFWQWVEFDKWMPAILRQILTSCGHKDAFTPLMVAIIENNEIVPYRLTFSGAGS